jgi:hypothetical protein
MNDLIRHRRELQQAIRNKHYEVSPHGILFPRMKAFIGGVFTTWLNGRDPQTDPNIIPTEGLNHILTTIAKNGTPVSPWYVALFSGNITPGATMTHTGGTAFATVATEFTDYDEATRVEWEEGAVATGSVDNSAARADFTMSTGVSSQVLRGAALASVSTKGSTAAGTLLACSRFASDRTVSETDVLSVQYTLSVTSS